MSSENSLCVIITTTIFVYALLTTTLILGLTGNASKLYNTFNFFTNANSNYDTWTWISSAVIMGLMSVVIVIGLLTVLVYKCCKKEDSPV